jgi:asparagine synthase (glutamine-hydrolysing)
MCGIVGIASQVPVTHRDLLIIQRDTMHHRGPDDAGVWWSADGRIGLAHRRLSIIDLSPGGHQPMQDSSGTLCITFNGEIYNYRDLRRGLEGRGHQFRSASDTEIILEAYRAWGTDCLKHFNGMFAFGLYDAEKQSLFLARDRVGEKPLFYRSSTGTLTFASELKALMANPAFPRRLNLEAFHCYLGFGYVPGYRCLLEGVNKLPPAHAMTFSLHSGASRVWRYWQLPAPPGDQIGAGAVDEEALLDELENLLKDAVKRQLVADVPVGILLSGGVDSSLVTATAVRSGQNVKTFTIRFPGYEEYDETKHARLIARHFGTEHVELEAEPSTVELLPLLARQYDEPMVDSSMIPTYLVSKLVRKHCTVALGGDGGDELFGGYIHYNRLLWMQEKLGWIPYGLRRGVAGLSAMLLPLGFKGRNWLQGLGTDLDAGLPLIATYFDSGARRALLRPGLVDGGTGRDSAESIRQQCIPKHKDLLQRATRMDFGNYLAEDILVKVDRASMLNSLEVRAPWLDYRIIEFAFGKVPSYLKATATNRKILSKMLASRLLPGEFDIQRKQGFSIPLASWLQGREWADYFRQVLIESDGGLFNHRFVADLLQGQARGRSNSERLFALVLFELWRKEYRVTV